MPGARIQESNYDERPDRPYPPLYDTPTTACENPNRGYRERRKEARMRKVDNGFQIELYVNDGIVARIVEHILPKALKQVKGFMLED